MFNTNRVSYSYNDVAIQPTPISPINSRSECNPYDKDGNLPIFTAPMSAVVDTLNMEDFSRNRIIPILPRSTSIATRALFCKCGRWVAFSLKEFEEYFVDNKIGYDPNEENDSIVYRALIDVANGHMQKIYDLVKTAKARIGAKHLIVMVGNIANPETYDYCVQAGVDFVRCGIGGGSGCFVDGTKITTKDGYKNIENIEVGEMVLTHDGTYHQVLNTLRYKDSTTKLVINNEITCTKEHKFFVVDKKDKDKINEHNLKDYGFWVEAQNLNKERHLLIKRLETEEDV